MSNTMRVTRKQTAEEIVGDDAYENKVQAQAEHLRISRDARAKVDEDAWKPPKLIDSNDMTLYEAVWLVEGYMELGTVGMLFGPWGSAKSFLSLEWAASIAAGRAWHDCPVRQQNVLYIASEGGRGMGKRFIAWKQQNRSIGKSGLTFIAEAVPLRSAQATEFICKMISEHEIGVVVIDTLARSIPGMNENDAGEMGQIIEALYRMRDAWQPSGTTVLVLHHTGKNEALGARGSSRFESDLDFTFSMSRGADQTRPYVLRHKKVKDNAPMLPFAFTLRQVDIDGHNGATSAIIEPTAVPELDEETQDSLDKIVTALESGGEFRQKEIQASTGLSHGAVSEGLKKLVEQGTVVSRGTRPLLYCIVDDA